MFFIRPPSFFSSLSVVVFSIIKMWCATWHIKPHKHESSERISSHLKKLIFTHTKKKMKCLLRVEARRRAGNLPHDTFCKQMLMQQRQRGGNQIYHEREHPLRSWQLCVMLVYVRWNGVDNIRTRISSHSRHIKVELSSSGLRVGAVEYIKKQEKKDMKTTAKPSKAAQEEV